MSVLLRLFVSIFLVSFHLSKLLHRALAFAPHLVTLLPIFTSSSWNTSSFEQTSLLRFLTTHRYILFATLISRFFLSSLLVYRKISSTCCFSCPHSFILGYVSSYSCVFTLSLTDYYFQVYLSYVFGRPTQPSTQAFETLTHTLGCFPLDEAPSHASSQSIVPS